MPNIVPRQLAFTLAHEVSFAREDFLSGPSNEAALRLIERWPDWPARAVALIGPAGSGKSHLASIWAADAGARIASGRSISEAAVPASLVTGAVAIEDVGPGRFDERALFHLLNLAREEGSFVLMTTQAPPSGWEVSLKDLASRLREMPAVTLSAPDDDLLRAILVKLFADRQLAVDETLIAYVMTRIERSFAAARTVVATLDREGLRRKRPVTRALAAELLGEG
jgi:chromosomal replication initiation ATPase DnaA